MSNQVFEMLKITSHHKNLSNGSHPSNDIFPDKNKISSIPIIRQSIPNSSKLRTRLRVNGYKNFTKIPAAGPNTQQILQNIKNSSCLKFATKLEFDPYLCNLSCLTELSPVLKKLKNIKQLSLILRRLNNNDSNETNRLQGIGSNFPKLLRLRRVRLEFPSNSNIDESQGHILYRALTKCYLLKSLEWIIVESPPLSTEGLKVFMTLMRKLRKLEYYKDYTTIAKGISNTDFYELLNYGDLPKIPQIKHFELTYSAPKDWSSMGENGDESNKVIKQYIERHINMEMFKLQLIRTSFMAEDILNLFQAFVPLANFKHLKFEFLSCGLGDMELAAFIYGLSQIPQLKYFQLKIIQSSPISMEYIEKFVDKLCSMNNLEKFDLYFRKQYISNRDVARIKNMFSRFKNVQCSCSPQSLYVEKTQS